MHYQPILPMLYRRPVPLNRARHASTTIAASPTGFRYAAEVHSVVLTGEEFADAGRCFPILFASGGEEGAILPVALLGLQAGENLCVGPAGQWQAPYIPAYIRRYPFIHARGESETTLCIDEAYDGIDREGGDPLFEEGEPSAYLQKVIQFVAGFEAQMVATEQLCRQLQALDLLKPVNAAVDLADGRRFTLTDFLLVDERKLLALGTEPLEALFRSGQLSMVYAHMLSLRSMQWLLDRKAKR